MIEFVLTEVQYSILVKMLCTSTFSNSLDLQSSLINFIRDLDPELFDDSFPCPATTL